jgi:hypothetical protein
MKTENDEFRLLEIFRKLNYGEIGDFDLLYRSSKNQLQQIRLCVKKKSPEAAERSKKAAIRDMNINKEPYQKKQSSYRVVCSS